jgi:hypothetical protein
MRNLLLSRRARWTVALVSTVAMASGTATAAAVASGRTPAPDHARRVAAPAAGGSKAAPAAPGTTNGTSPPAEFSSTANPITLDAPPAVPPSRPVVVTIADHAAFGNGPPPAVTTVNLPKGNFAEVVLQVVGSETGRQYDRLCEIFDGPTEIFLGVTPEPTPQGITWQVEKDVTGYLPLLQGRRTFSTYVDNYLSSIDTGIPTITAKLLFYPAAGEFQPPREAGLPDPALAGDAIEETGPAAPATHPAVPSTVVPLLPNGASNTLATIGSGQTVSATVTLPHDISTATLDLYAVGQSTDEFWWSLVPAFREIEVSIDGKPAGVVWPFPYVYTGGVNPLIWRPLTGIHTLDIPSYRLDLTPFAGTLGGTRTVSLTVAGNAGYWLAGGSLLLTTDRHPTSGTLDRDTLTFPTTSTVTTADALGSSNQPVSTEAANTSYEISGTVVAGGRSWTDTLRQSLEFGDDQSDIDPSCSGACYQWVHGQEVQTTSEDVTGPAGVLRSDHSSWTIDAPNGYLPSSDGSDFFLPASVDQQLTDLARQAAPGGGLGSSLLESIVGYGALEEDGGAPTITNGDTTGTITWRTTGPAPQLYQRSVVTRGGQILQDLRS